MSCCLILQMKDSVCIGADTATSVQSGNNFIRYSNDGKKIFEIGKDIVYCSGDMSYVPEVIDHIRLQDGYVDVMYMSRYLKKKTFTKTEGFDYPSIGVLICRVVNGVSYVYDLSESRDFDVVTHTVTQNGIQIWVGGIYNEKCLETATRNIKKFNGEVIQTYIHTYKEMACQEIGGNIHVYYMDANGCQKIIDNYDLNDGYCTVLSGRGRMHGIIADNIIGNLIASDTMFIGNKEGSVQITGNGIKITNGTIAWGEDSVNAPEIENINGLKNSLTSIEGNLEQLDGRIQTYSQSTDPKTTGSTKWSDSDNEKHLGDVWVNTENGVVYVFAKEGSTYKWTETQDSNLKALAQSKAQVFTSKSGTISNGYSVGDLWILESDTVLSGYKKGTVLIANANAGKNNTFNKSHWQEATVKNATDALEQVGEISDDSKVTPSEKQQLKLIWIGIVAEKATLEECASIYGVESTDYNAKYKSLKTYLEPILRSLKTTTNIVKSTFDGKFQDYYTQRDALQEAVDKKKKKYVDDSVKNVSKNISDFQDKVNHALMGNATTEIGKDYVISPKIGGGYMYIKGNNEIKIEINPEGTEFDGHNGDYVFNISKRNKLIMGVDNEGNGHFSGKISGSEISAGTITGTTISGGKITGTAISAGTIDGCEISSGIITSSFEGNCTTIFNGGITNESNIYNTQLHVIGGNLMLQSLSDGSISEFEPQYLRFRKNDNIYFYIGEDSFQIGTESIFDGDVYIVGQLTVNGEIIPNSISTLGTANYRWNEVYTSNSSITTSDRNLKENIKPLSKKHIDFFRLLAPVSFTFKDGKSGRTHIGFISQDVEEAMDKVGLTDLDFAGFCKDIKTVVKCDEDGQEIEEPDLDENGNVQYIYSLRYGEFIALNTYMIQDTMNKIDKLEQENGQLMERLEKLETLVSNYNN